MVDHRQLTTEVWLKLAENFYARLGTYMRSLSAAQWQRPTTYLGWNCLELATHLTSAITINFRTLVGMAMEGKPLPPAGFNIFLRNARAVDERRDRTVGQVMDEYEREIAAMLGVYRSLSEGDWKRPAFFFIGDTDIRMLFLVQLSDNVVHERDLHVAQGEDFLFDVSTTAPLLDWFITAFRAASFRPDLASGVDRSVQYNITGSVPGEWHMIIRDGMLRTGQGRIESPDLEVSLTTEALVDLSLARARPWAGIVARKLSAITSTDRREDFTARFTAHAALMGALLGGKVKFQGDKRVRRELQRVFWHFWERMPQTQYNIARSALRGS
jgi:hypothetical protein